jgi:hypothetical protein
MTIGTSGDVNNSREARTYGNNSSRKDVGISRSASNRRDASNSKDHKNSWDLSNVDSSQNIDNSKVNSKSRGNRNFTDPSKGRY